jgi:hypothetical protein
MCLFMVCHEPAKSPLRWWNKEGDKSAIRWINILNSLKRSAWTRQQAMCNLKDIIALSPKLELGCRWGAGRNWSHFSQPKTCSHYSWWHHLARRRQGQGWHDGMHPCVNQITSQGLTTDKALKDHDYDCKMMFLSHWRWSLHANINEAPSLIIKTDGVSLTEQLFAMPPEDKDH